MAIGWWPFYCLVTAFPDSLCCCCRFNSLQSLHAWGRKLHPNAKKVLQLNSKHFIFLTNSSPKISRLLLSKTECLLSTETIRLIRDEENGGGWRAKNIYLSLHNHHQNDSYIKTCSDESHFNVSLIVRDKVTRQCPQTTTFEEKGEPKRIRIEGPLLASLSPYR